MSVTVSEPLSEVPKNPLSESMSASETIPNTNSNTNLGRNLIRVRRSLIVRRILFNAVELILIKSLPKLSKSFKVNYSKGTVKLLNLR